MKQRDLVQVIEACYAQEGGVLAWLTAVHEVMSPLLDKGLGTSAYRYDVSTGRVRVFESIGKTTAVDLIAMKRALTTVTEGYVVKGYRALPATMASEVPGFEEQPAMKTFFRPSGVEDILAINAFDPSGRGVCLGGFRRAREKLSPRARASFARLSAHVASGFRLRNRLTRAKTRSDAVMTPSGRILHAEGDAQLASARAVLADAARAIDKARGSLRRRDPEEAVSRWRALVSARWSLVDQFESDGKRYLVASSNAPAVPEVAGLSTREAQVMTYAMLGHHNKLIAYELGIAPSTVRVLFMRVARKLGTATRESTVERFVALTRPGAEGS